MSALVAIFIVGVLAGAYWLGWNDRELKAQTDEAFRRLDVVLGRATERQEP